MSDGKRDGDGTTPPTYKWGKPSASRTWHIFGDDGMCLCRRWGFFAAADESVSVGGLTPRGGDCKKCVAELNRIRGHK